MGRLLLGYSRPDRYTFQVLYAFPGLARYYPNDGGLHRINPMLVDQLPDYGASVLLRERNDVVYPFKNHTSRLLPYRLFIL